MKNRMREICTSGSVRGGGGNAPTYSAALLADRCQVTQERPALGKMRDAAEEGELAGIVERQQPGQEQSSEQRAEHTHRQ